MIFDMKNAFTLVLGVKAFQRVEKENAAVKFAQKLQKTSYVQNVPPERFEGLIYRELLEGEAVVFASPRNAVAFLTPCSVISRK
ncbi:MAG: hypothetical protein J6A37_13335 [Oscillospiraceae bacterium]|nr:hypothetical protein [Oscillospiraceae bacterium]